MAHFLKQLMYPESIAVYGASNNPMKMGTMQMTNILETGYRGEVYPIHPREEVVLGLPAFRSVREVGKPVDLALLVLPTGAVEEALRDCGEAGVKRAIIVSGGFKELEGEEGRRREERITGLAHSYGIRFVGPNCLGVFNSGISLNTTTIPEPPGGGRIALASQSGAYTAMIYPYLRSMGVKLGQTISVGNEADVDLVDCLDYFREEEEITAIGLYVETVRRPREFVRAARRTAGDKPVAAIYVGGTEAGSRSSRSHTGALTGPEELYDGLFRQAGVLRADDIDDMIDMLWALSSQPLGGGKRVAVITNSGGPGTSLAYHAEKAGLAVPRFSAGLSSKLGRLTGPLAYVGNPVDLTFNTDVHVFKELLETVFDSGEVDGALLYGVFGAEDFMVNLKKRFPQLAEFAGQWDRHYRDFLGELAEVPRRYAKPLVVMSFLGSGSPAIDALVSGGVPVYPSARRAALALRSLLCRREGGSSRGDGDGGLGGGGG